MKKQKTHGVLDREFYDRNTKIVANDLLGMRLVRKIGNFVISGKIVETEGYLGEDDPAAHARFGKTDRTKVLYGPPGHAYVYQSRHHFLLNVVAEEKGNPGCVLIRALEPVDGIESMKKTRKVHEIKNLTNGPAKLCQSLQIDLNLYGKDLTRGGTLYIAKPLDYEEFELGNSGRIGISNAKDWQLRFFIKGNKFISN